MMVPFMFGWGSQWYGNVPGTVNRNENRSLECKRGEPNAGDTPGSLVTVWSFESPLNHVTVVLRATVKFLGTYGSAAAGAPCTIRMSADSPEPDRRCRMRGAAATLATRLPTANPRIATDTRPPVDSSDARYFVCSMPAFHFRRETMENPRTRNEIGSDATVSHAPGEAGFAYAVGMMKENRANVRTVTTIPAISPHLFALRVPYADSRKTATIARMINVVGSVTDPPNDANRAMRPRPMNARPPAITQRTKGFPRNITRKPREGSTIPASRARRGMPRGY